MRILLWHGYLLGGTGSNVYSRALAREWSRAGHDVTVLSQEPHPEAYDLGGAATVRPDVGGFLPVFVLDRYEGYEVQRLPDAPRERVERWVAANAAAVREHLPADFVFANHVLLGGPVGAAAGVPYVVKAHGSELEYAMRGNAELSAWGAEALAGARATVVGSEHIRTVVAEVCGHTDRGGRGAARGRRRALAAGGAGRRARRAPRGGGARPAEPRQRRGAPARTRGTPGGSRRSWRATGRRSSTSGS